MLQDEKQARFFAVQKGYYNDRIVYPAESFYASEKINVAPDGDKPKMVPFESVTSWVKKMSTEEK